MTQADLIGDLKAMPDTPGAGEESPGYNDGGLIDDGDPGYWPFASRASKERVTVRFDRDVLAFFRRSGKGYQTRMNAALRAYMRTLEKAPDQASRPGR